MRTPKITISGPAGSGKTTLVYALAAALNAHGITVKVSGCEDETPAAKEKGSLNWRQRMAMLFAPKSDKSIEIETVRTKD